MKLDHDLELTSNAFADARNIRGADLFSTVAKTLLDISFEVLNGLEIVSAKPQTGWGLAKWSNLGLVGAKTLMEAWSFGVSVTKMSQAGRHIYMSFDPNIYRQSVNNILDKAEVVYCALCDDKKNNYKNYIKASLSTGIAGETESPIWFVVRNVDFERSTKETLRGANAARVYAIKRLNELVIEIEKSVVNENANAAIIRYLEDMRRRILLSAVKQTDLNYETFLKKDSGVIGINTRYSLGRIAALDNFRGEMLSDFGDGIDDEFKLTIEQIIEPAVDAAIAGATVYANYSLSLSAIMAGQATANKVLANSGILH